MGATAGWGCVTSEQHGALCEGTDGQEYTWRFLKGEVNGEWYGTKGDWLCGTSDTTP